MCLISAVTHSPSNTAPENDEAGFCLLENCNRSHFLLATKRPLPAAAADKPFWPFVVCSWRRIKVAASASGLWGLSGGISMADRRLRLNGFVSTLDYVCEPTDCSSGATVLCTVDRKPHSEPNGFWSTPSLVSTRYSTRARDGPHRRTLFFFYADEKRLDQYRCLPTHPSHPQSKKKGWAK